MAGMTGMTRMAGMTGMTARTGVTGMTGMTRMAGITKMTRMTGITRMTRMTRMTGMTTIKMIKASLDTLMPVYVKLFNSILTVLLLPSINHAGIMNQKFLLMLLLLQITVGDCFYNLIKSLYFNSTYAIKIAHKQT